MISIKPRNVPEYLKGSAFFANLSEDDEEVSVPKDCCKVDTSVTNASELEELLRTMRFWGVDIIPTHVVDFLASTDLAVWKTVTANYATDLPLLAPCVQVFECKREQRVCVAASLSDVSLVAYLLEHGCPAEHESDNMDAPTRAVDIAAGYGDVDMLRVLRLHNCEFSLATSKEAALGGHVACLDYLMQNGCPVAKGIISWAMCSGNVKIIEYLYDRGLPWPENILRELHDNCAWDDVAENVKVCLLYAYQLGCPRDIYTCNVASRYGWLDLLVDAHEHGCSLDSRCTRAAATCGHLVCLIYLHENGCLWDYLTACVALENKHFDCFTYAVEHGCDVSEFLFKAAVSSGSIEMIQYLHDRGTSWPHNILSGIDLRVSENCEDSDNQNAAACLQYAYQLGCPRDLGTCNVASRFGWYDILVDAHEHGCKWDEETTQSALRNLTYGTIATEKNTVRRDKYYECLIYAVEHGCPLPAKGNKHWWPKDTELQQYLIGKGAVPPLEL